MTLDLSAPRRVHIVGIGGMAMSGIAAVLMQYYPELSAADVRRIILDSAIQYRDRLVLAPGGKGDPIPFGRLSATGGIANLYAALKLAGERAAH